MLRLTVKINEPVTLSQNGQVIGVIKVGERKRAAGQAALKFDGFVGIDIVRERAKDKTPAEWADDADTTPEIK